MLICGIMTGTSVDAIDTAICDFYQKDGKECFDLIAYHEYQLPEKIKTKITEIITENTTIKDISQMNFALSRLYADAVIALCKDADISIDTLEAVAIHGQTVWHNPTPENFCGIPTSSTLQLFSIPAVAEYLCIKVIGDFRSADVACGGQGAPLIPIFDYAFLKSDTQNVATLNIGGMANITYLPKACSSNEVIAFDTGAGNVLLDYLSKRLFEIDFDKNGDMARKGCIIPELMNELMQTPYIHAPLPKSTGRELFNPAFLSQFNFDIYDKFDIMATFTEFTVWSIAKNLELFALSPDIIYCSGGGGKNAFMMERLQALLPLCKIASISDAGIAPDAKEAICFAYLGYRHLLGLPSNMPSVTGAKRECVLGISSAGKIDNKEQY